MENKTPALDAFRKIEIRRPQYPWILEWIDREFHVRWINTCAMPGANISCLLEDNADEDEDPIVEEGRKEIWAYYL